MPNSSMLKLIIIFVCLLGYSFTSAQTDYVVLTSGDTLYGTVKHLNYGVDQKVQLTDQDKKKTLYSMFQVKSFFVDNEVLHLVKMIDRYKYMKPVKIGYLSLYNFQIDNQISYDGRFLIKIDGNGIEVPNLSFKKRLSDFLSECPDLSDEVRSGQLGKNELDEIIDKFNACIDQRTAHLQPVKEKVVERSNKVSAWSELLTAVKNSDNLTDKQNILEMISEAKSKTERGEKLPNFLVEGLKKLLEQDATLKDLLTKALGQIEKD